MTKDKVITKQDILDDYIKLTRNYYKSTKKARIPRDVYRAHTVISEDLVRKYFGGLSGLRIEAEKILNLKTRNNTEIKNNFNSKKYIITSIVEGASINEDFFQALKLYADKNNSQLILIWTKGVKCIDIFDPESYKRFQPYLVTSGKLNDNLAIGDFSVHPTQMDPLKGLDRFGTKETSLIVGSTKLMMASIPRPKGQIPHLLWSTGTLSLPSYSRTRSGVIAQQDNHLSALVVEIESNKKFYIRPVEWVNNCFVDLGKAYYKNKVKDIETEAMVLGDLHLGEENQTALKVSLNQIDILKPKKIFLHDIISFNSISHHNFGKYLTKSLVPEHINTLEKELEYAKNILSKISNKIKANIFIVHSNHDDFLYKYLDNGEFIKDISNSLLGAEFFIDFRKGINPVEKYLKLPKLNFLKEDTSYKVNGIECGIHGDKGNNGGKGTPNAFRKSNDKIILGHSHQPRILGDTWYVGTLSQLSLPYTKGNSSWLHANAIIYANNGRQLIIWIDEKWKL